MSATTESPGVTLTINGTPAKSGQPTALSGGDAGASTVTIDVLAADRATKKTYTIALN